MALTRTVKPTQDYVVVEKIVHRAAGILDLDLSMVNDQSMFDIRIVSLGPDVTISIKPEDLVECVSNNMAVPLPDMTGGEYYIVKQKDIIGVYSFGEE